MAPEKAELSAAGFSYSGIVSTKSRRNEHMSLLRLAKERRSSLAFLGSVVLAVIGAFAVAFGVLGVFRGNQDNNVAEARAFLSQEIPDRILVQPGQILYIRTEVYTRYGPKTAEIAAATGIQSERHVRESWNEIGPDDTIQNVYSRLLGETGTILQQSSFLNGQWRAVPDKLGTLTRQSGPPTQLVQQGALRINGPKELAGIYEKALAEERARVIQQTTTELTVELQDPLPDVAKNKVWGPGDWQVPFTGDLKPVAIATRVTIRNDGVVPLAQSYVITSEGRRVLVQEEKTTHQTVDQMPQAAELGITKETVRDHIASTARELSARGGDLLPEN